MQHSVKTTLAVAALTLMVSAGACRAEPKQDIRGLKPGMTFAQYEEQINHLIDEAFRNVGGFNGTVNWWFRKIFRIGAKGCTREPSWNGDIDCKLEGNSLRVSFTDTLRPRVIRLVSMTFWSDLAPKLLINKISDQYGLLPPKMPTEENQTSVYGASWLGVKLPLAEWKLSDHISLKLSGYQNYELSLSSLAVENQNDQARRDSQGKTNLSPQF
jgi:hypothetical protein